MTRFRDQAPDLFTPPDCEDTVEAPLAERMRPRVFADFVGQGDIAAPDRAASAGHRGRPRSHP